MFSAITIPSSTKIPITMIIPKRESTLMVTLNMGAKTNIPKKAIGSPKATQNANLVFKKRDRNTKTRIIPTMAFSVSNWVRWVNVVERSSMTSNRTLVYFSLNSSIYCLTFSAEPIKSSVLVLVMVMFTASSPLK